MNETKLHDTWSFWYQQKSKGTSWSDGISCLARTNTVENFWSIWSHILRPDTIRGQVDLMVFRDGIQPIWEHEANSEGGKFYIKVSKKAGATNQMWEELLMATLGENPALGPTEDICGIKVVNKFNDEVIQIWNKSGENEHIINSLRDGIRKVLHLPEWVDIGYVTHRKRLIKNKEESPVATAGNTANTNAGNNWQSNTNSNNNNSNNNNNNNSSNTTTDTSLTPSVAALFASASQPQQQQHTQQQQQNSGNKNSSSNAPSSGASSSAWGRPNPQLASVTAGGSVAAVASPSSSSSSPSPAIKSDGPFSAIAGTGKHYNNNNNTSSYAAVPNPASNNPNSKKGWAAAASTAPVQGSYVPKKSTADGWQTVGK